MDRSDRAFEAQGQWWLPGNGDRPIAGTLKFDLDTGAELSLIGSLRTIFEEGETSNSNGTTTVTMTTDALERAGRYPRIHGYADGKSYTLEDCFRVRSKGSLLGATRIELINVNQVFRGAVIPDRAPLHAGGIVFDLRYLTHWIGESTIKEKDIFSSKEGVLGSFRGHELSARLLDDRVIATSDSRTITLKHAMSVRGERILERTLAQRFYFRIDAPGFEDIDELVETASDLQDLVSIGVGRPAEFEGMSFLDIPNSMSRSADYFVNWNIRDNSRNPSQLPSHEIVFSFRQIDGMEGILRWLESAARHRATLGRVMSSHYSRSMYVSDRLLNRAAAVEGLDRKITGTDGDYLKARLRRCATLVGSSFTSLVGDVTKWAEEIRVSRNNIAHHLSSAVKQENLKQYYLAESLYWLFVLTIFRDARFPDDVFDEIAENESFKRLGRKVKSVL